MMLTRFTLLAVVVVAFPNVAAVDPACIGSSCDTQDSQALLQSKLALDKVDASAKEVIAAEANGGAVQCWQMRGGVWQTKGPPRWVKEVHANVVAIQQYYLKGLKEGFPRATIKAVTKIFGDKSFLEKWQFTNLMTNAPGMKICRTRAKVCGPSGQAACINKRAPGGFMTVGAWDSRSTVGQAGLWFHETSHVKLRTGDDSYIATKGTFQQKKKRAQSYQYVIEKGFFNPMLKAGLMPCATSGNKKASDKRCNEAMQGTEFVQLGGGQQPQLDEDGQLIQAYE